MNSPHRETLEEAGYVYLAPLADGEHLLEDASTGQNEVWGENEHHSSSGLAWNGTDLEYVRDEEVCSE